MLASFTKNLGQELRGAVRDEMLFGKTRSTVHKDYKFEDSLNSLKVSQGAMKRPEQIDCHRPSGAFSLFSCQFQTQLSGPRLAIRFGDMAREKEKVSAASVRHKSRDGCCKWWQRDTERLDLLVNRHWLCL